MSCPMTCRMACPNRGKSVGNNPDCIQAECVKSDSVSRDQVNRFIKTHLYIVFMTTLCKPVLMLECEKLWRAPLTERCFGPKRSHINRSRRPTRRHGEREKWRSSERAPKTGVYSLYCKHWPAEWRAARALWCKHVAGQVCCCCCRSPLLLPYSSTLLLLLRMIHWHWRYSERRV